MQQSKPSNLTDDNEPAQASKTIFITCAALGREVKAIIKKHGWNADFRAIDAKLHLRPQKIGPAVEAELIRAKEGQYERQVVVYGHCGAFDLDGILETYGAVRPLGPHCYEQYGGQHFADTLKEEPGTFILTDFLIRAWDKFVVQGLKIDKHPKLKALLFHHYKRLLYYSQQEDNDLIARAREIADWLNLPLQVEHVEYGDLERRLVAIMEDREQPSADMTFDGYNVGNPIPG